ncbi:TetR/AcrR family transcriptional regulator [Slackia heliotrinireducens]|uniref:TetR/AcrR family transcriptional regulator n=1 Tax=Slackia heliotrinireducens TaxID=84110 RepID=UPI003315DBC3
MNLLDTSNDLAYLLNSLPNDLVYLSLCRIPHIRLRGSRKMGRSKYSPEARNAIMAAFVKATKEIIAAEGVDAVSIRRVSSAAGYSSATLYLYFEDMNELVTMSLISDLSAYARDIINTTPENETPRGEYLRSWRIFCNHAFANPSVFLGLFYGPQSQNVDAIAKKYYELFPEEVERASGRMLNMLERGTLSARNLVVLDSFGHDLGFSDEDISLANDLTIAYFRSFLMDACERNLSEEDVQALTDRFMKGALFLLRTSEEE